MWGLYLFGIMKILGLDVVEHLIEELPCFPMRHGEVVEKPVATILRCSTGNLTFEVGNKAERAAHQVYNIL